MPEYRIIPTSGRIHYYGDEKTALLMWDYALSLKDIPNTAAILQVLDEETFLWTDLEEFGYRERESDE